MEVAGTHGERNHVVMMGGLHTEMTIWSTFGNYLEGSGWTTALIQAGAASSGTAENFLKASHLTRTRYSHQVSALALDKLQEMAYVSTDGSMPKEAWRETMKKCSPIDVSLLGYYTLSRATGQCFCSDTSREKIFSLFGCSQGNCPLVFCARSLPLCLVDPCAYT